MSPLSLADLGHGCHVGFLFRLALDDQVSLPDLEPEPALDSFLVLADPQREDKIGLVLPGELEFESRPGRKPEITANRGALLVRPGLPLFFLPATFISSLLPAHQSIGTQIYQVSTRFPAVHPVDDRALDVQPSDPCDFELGFPFIHGKQRAKDNIPSRQLEAIITVWPGELGGTGKCTAVTPLRGKTNGAVNAVACQRMRSGWLEATSAPGTNPPLLRWSTAEGGSTGGAAPALVMPQSHARVTTTSQAHARMGAAGFRAGIRIRVGVKGMVYRS